MRKTPFYHFFDRRLYFGQVYWHFPEKRAKEHERERLFEHSGVRVYRFDAKLCSINPEAVVSELIELMSK